MPKSHRDKRRGTIWHGRREEGHHTYCQKSSDRPVLIVTGAEKHRRITCEDCLARLARMADSRGA